MPKALTYKISRFLYCELWVRLALFSNICAVNSPGGSVSAGMAIYDTMQYIPCDVATVCFGTAASMGAFLLCSGAPGKRKSLPNSRIMIHQPLGGAQGQAADIEIQAKEILFVKSLLNRCRSLRTCRSDVWTSSLFNLIRVRLSFSS